MYTDEGMMINEGMEESFICTAVYSREEVDENRKEVVHIMLVNFNGT